MFTIHLTPNYNETTFIDEMSASNLPLLSQHRSHELIIAGDCKQLDLHNLCASTGTVCLPSSPTRGTNTLDQFLVTDTECFRQETYPAIIQSDHSLVMCYSKEEDSNSRALKIQCGKRQIQCGKRHLHPHPTIKQLLDMQQYISALKLFNVCQGEKSTDKIYDELRKQ